MSYSFVELCMRVLLIHNYYKERGGEDAVFEFELQALRKAGVCVDEFSIHNKETETRNPFESFSCYAAFL